MVKKLVENENDVLLKSIGFISIIVIIISLASFGMNLTGFAASEMGFVNVTVESSANINMSTNNIDFGSGVVNATNYPNAILESNASDAEPRGNWSWTATNFSIENIGNVNVTLQLKTGKTANTLIGGTGSSYQYFVYNAEANSCFNNRTSMVVWHNVNTTGDGTMFCGNFTYLDDKDLIQIDIKLVIPSDSFIGDLGDVFTAKATAV